MARFGIQEMDSYVSKGGGAGFFSLKNDKDIATVRFLYNGEKDIGGYSVHEIEVNGKKRYVNCIREAKDPVEACPLCNEKYKMLVKLFIPLYDEESGEVKIWDRGNTYKAKLEALCSRYSPLVSTIFEIERNGKKGDTSTDYSFFATTSDDLVLENFPEVPELFGTLILDKNYDELIYFLDNGYFEEVNEEVNEEVRPRTTRVETRAVPSERRTPASTGTQANSNRRPANKF